MDRQAREQLATQNAGATIAAVLEAVQAIRAGLDALGDQLAELHRGLAKIEARREARANGDSVEPWVPVVAV